MGVAQARHHRAPRDIELGGVGEADRAVRHLADAAVLDDHVAPFQQLPGHDVQHRCIAQHRQCHGSLPRSRSPDAARLRFAGGQPKSAEGH